MALTAYLEILYNDRFWLILLLVLVVAIYFAKRNSPPHFPRAGKFCARHKRGITRATDAGFVLLIVLWFLFPLSAIKNLFNAQSQPEPLQTLLMQAAWLFLFMSLTAWTGIVSFFIGLLSVFQSNITKFKRIFLLILCLFPVVFTLLHVMALMDADENPWLAVRIYCCWPLFGLILNASAIFTGKPLSRFFADVVQMIKPIPADQQD